MATKKSNDIAKLVKELAEDLHTISRLKFGKPSVREAILKGLVSEVVAGATAGIWSKAQRQLFEVLFLQEETRLGGNVMGHIHWLAQVNYGIEKGLARAREAHGYDSSPVTALQCHVCGLVRDIEVFDCPECLGNGMSTGSMRSEQVSPDEHRKYPDRSFAEEMNDDVDDKTALHSARLEADFEDFTARRRARFELEQSARFAELEANDRADFEAGRPA
jgi:hypothetical protein